MTSVFSLRALPMLVAVTSLAFGGVGCAADEAEDDGSGEDPGVEGAVADEADTASDSAAISVGGANCYYVHYKNPNAAVPVYRKSTRPARYDSVPARGRAYLVQPDGSAPAAGGYVRSKNGSLRIQWTMGMAAWIYWKNVSCGG